MGRGSAVIALSMESRRLRAEKLRRRRSRQPIESRRRSSRFVDCYAALPLSKYWLGHSRLAVRYEEFSHYWPNWERRRDCVLLSERDSDF
jgi:hypothetical protein